LLNLKITSAKRHQQCVWSLTPSEGVPVVHPGPTYILLNEVE